MVEDQSHAKKWLKMEIEMEETQTNVSSVMLLVKG